jgi:hypothetical protein
MREGSTATADAERSAAMMTALRMLVTIVYYPRWRAPGVSFAARAAGREGNLPRFLS